MVKLNGSFDHPRNEPPPQRSLSFRSFVRIYPSTSIGVVVIRVIETYGLKRRVWVCTGQPTRRRDTFTGTLLLGCATGGVLPILIRRLVGNRAGVDKILERRFRISLCITP